MQGGTHPFFLNSLISNLTPILVNKKVVDVGCGKGINGYVLRTTRDLEGATLIGLDVNEWFLDFCKHHRVYDKYVKAKIPTLPFSDKSIDFLICTEVIEHLTKRDGQKLLSEIDRVCRGRALVSTPNVFFDTIHNKDADAHRSLWAPNDFRTAGYSVYGMGFKVALLYNQPLLKFKQALYYIMTPLSYFIPEFGGALVCVKDY